MRKLLFASFVFAAMAVPALAHVSDTHLCRPYAIVMTCDADMPSCGRPHMVYAPGQSLAGNPVGKYFYMTRRRHRHHHHGGDADDRLAYQASMNCQHMHAWWD